MSNGVVVFSINWTPVSDPSVTGYNIYTVHGAPPTQTKVFLAFVSNASSSSYLYQGVEGTQYEFEVRSTDGVNESPPMEVFYPDGTSIYTPTNITPTGKPMQIIRDIAYLTKDEYINYPNGLKLTNTSTLYTSGVLDTFLQSASEQVNRYAKRHFGVQTIDEVYHGIRIGQDEPKLITVPLTEGPIQQINRIDIQVLKFFINFDLTYLQVFPDQGFIQLVPFLGGNASGIPLPSAALLSGMLGKVWVNYTFGYDVIPTDVKMATAFYCTYMIGLQENPVGAKSVSFGRNFRLEWDEDKNPLVAQAQRLLAPYRNSIYRRP